MTSLRENGEDLTPRKPPDIDRARFLTGLSADLDIGQRENSLTALLLVDIKNFRHLNRRFGYGVGDSILAHVHSQLKDNVKKASIISRLGDDLFAIVVPEMQSLRLLPVAASKVQQILAEPIRYQSQDIRLECYVGVSVAPLHANHEEAFLIHAERSLEQARQEREGRFVADGTSDKETLNEWKLRDELNRAIGAGELALHYQPKVSLQNFMPVACEALMRWNSPTLGNVRPDIFIPIAETTGLISDLTEWAILTLPREASHIEYRDKLLNISLNLSPNDLVSGNLQATLESALNIWEMSSENITLEITESSLMDNPDQCFEMMEELKSLGFKISIDDFGTGYSSMSYFKLIPANEIKIDKCFVSNLVTDRDDQIIVRAIIAIAHHFGMSVVAEGVEDMATLEMLMKMKCDYAQGYHFTKPLPGGEFREWLDKYNMIKYFSPPKKMQRAANS
ncbi:MAG: putative bifunctional diguanylate cyclase/phosphodiesterase [Pseudomonadales bacterium]